jgi:hypothetical protein
MIFFVVDVEEEQPSPVVKNGGAKAKSSKCHKQKSFNFKMVQSLSDLFRATPIKLE